MAVSGPIKESRRLRITIGHRARTIERREAELAALKADKVRLEQELEKVVRIEAAAARTAV